MPGDPTVLKQQSSEFWREPMRVHQDVLVAELYGLADRDLLAYPAGAYLSNGTAWMRARAWIAGLSADATVGEKLRVRAYTFPAFAESLTKMAASASDQAKQQGAGIMIADYTVVCGGNVFVEKHPVTGAATPGLRWYEMNNVNTEHYVLDTDQFKVDPPTGSYRGITPVNMKQQVVIVGTGADWTLSFRGQETAVMSETESAASMKTKLEALSTIGTTAIASVVESPDKTYLITFEKDLGGAALPLLVADKGSLDSATVTEDTAGVSGRQIEFRIDLMADIGLHFDLCSLDGTGNATRAALSLKRVS
jgi:hypothetical protein